VPYQPTAKWAGLVSEARVIEPVLVLVADGAPAIWSTHPVAWRNYTLAASNLNFTTTAGYIQQTMTSRLRAAAADRVFTASVWALATDVSLIRLELDDLTVAPATATHRVSYGHWRRYSVTFTAPAGSPSTSLKFRIANADSIGGNLMVQWAQVEEWPGVTAYEDVATTTPGRKNILLHSDTFTGASWVVSSCTPTAAAADGPKAQWDSNLLPGVAGALRVRRMSSLTSYPLDGRYAVGALDAELQDVGGWVTRWVATERAGAGRTYMAPVRLYLGTPELREDEYQPIWDGFITDVNLDDGIRYTVEGVSRAISWERAIMTNCGEVTGSVTVPDVITAYDVFLGNSDLSTVDGAYNSWKLKFTSGRNEGQERTVSSYTGSTRQFILATGVTNPIDPGDGFRVHNIVTIRGNPINIWVRCLLGDFAVAGQVQTDFPLTSVSGATPTGLTHGYIDLDVAQIQSERDKWTSGYTFVLPWVAPENAKDTFEHEIFQVIRCYPVLRPDGRYRIKMMLPITPEAVPVEIRDEYVASLPQWERVTERAITRIRVFGDFNTATKQYQLLADRTPFDPRFLSAVLPRTRTLDIRARGLTTATGGVAIAEATADRILARFGTGGYEEIEVRAGPRLALLEPGDRVSVTLARAPNLAAGTMGKISEPFEVTHVDLSGELAVRLALTSFAPVGRGAFIGPDTMATDYSAASAADKEYAYVSPTSGAMSDGGLPYVVI